MKKAEAKRLLNAFYDEICGDFLYPEERDMQVNWFLDKKFNNLNHAKPDPLERNEQTEKEVCECGKPIKYKPIGSQEWHCECGIITRAN